MNFQNDEIFSIAKHIQIAADSILVPPEDGFPSRTQDIIPMSIVTGTRGCTEKVTNQVNGCYEHGWYDACAVMIRRLLETLIIETFEKYSIAARVQSSNGDFYFLKDLIGITLSETSWNLARNTKVALPKLKDIGDKSAHSRRFNAHKRDIDQLKSDIRTVVQELIYLACLK